MCVSLLVASTLITAAGSFATAAMSSSAAQTEAFYRDQQLRIQNQQLMQDMQMAEIQGMQQENVRMDQARKLQAANEAFLASSGVGQSMSFMQGTAQENDIALRKDVANLRLQSITAQSRIADQIVVNNLEQQFVKQKASMAGQQAYANAFFNTASSAVSNAYRYQTYKVGK